MRFFLTTITAILLALLLPVDSAFAQQWRVDLVDFTEEDPELDRIRAEAMEFLPDGKTVSTAGHFYDGATKTGVGEVRLRDIKDGSLKMALQGTADSYSMRAGTLAISPDGKQIAAAGRVGRGNNRQSIVDIFDPTAGKLVRTLKAGVSPISWVTFSPGGKTLACAHHTGEVDLWNPNTGEKIKRLTAIPAGVWPVAFSPDGETLAGGSSPGVIFHDVKTGKRIGKIDLTPDLEFIGSLAFSPDGKLLAVGGFPPPGKPSPICVCEWNVTEAGKVRAQLKQTFQGHKEYTYSVAFSPDSKLLASASQDNTARIWDLNTNKELKTITAHDDFIYDVAFSPKGDALATLGRDALMMWTMKKLKKEK